MINFCFEQQPNTTLTLLSCKVVVPAMPLAGGFVRLMAFGLGERRCAENCNFGAGHDLQFVVILHPGGVHASSGIDCIK